MNKFSSLSTSVLLALLTSSAAASAYADSLENFNSRTSARSSNDSGETNTLRIGATDRHRNRDKDLEPVSLPSINSSADNFYSEDIVFQADKGNYIASLDPNDNAQSSTISGAYTSLQAQDANTSIENSIDKAISSIETQAQAHDQVKEQAQNQSPAQAKSSDVLGTAKLTSPLPIMASNLPMARCEHNINLNLAQDHFHSSDDPADQRRAYLGNAQGLGLRSGNNFSPAHTPSSEPAQIAGQSVNVAFDYPKDLTESFMVAGDTTVISYSADDSNFMITLKITPLDDEQSLSFDDFKARLLQRFSDKDNMLYGEYEILQEVRSTQDALKISHQGSHQSVFNYPIDPNVHYMELSLRAYLKKGSDGVLPDMQNYFYERSIVSHNIIATLSCELFGRQSQAAVVKQQFEELSPLCERILQSYHYNFN